MDMSCQTPKADAAAPQHPEEVARRIANHPCYSDQAHHRAARLHLAVAPSCNIQCNYCNRKYDCSNESRPGVVSELLTPTEAAHKVAVVAARLPELSVVGIAGPGDPLANPKRSFETFQRVAAVAPGVTLCLSTNGLALADQIDRLVALGVGHVTITINALDPGIGEKIYPWVFWNHRRLRGRAAAAVLIRRQLTGLDRAVAAGMLVKINSVLIPGVNDHHMGELSREMRARGAFLHNIMPLIAEPGHGTYFGVMGQRPPTDDELEAVRRACGDAGSRVMRHCRQCRADAVGRLGEDLGAAFTKARIGPPPAAPAGPAGPRPMVVAVATSGLGTVDLALADALAFQLFEVSPAGVIAVGERRVAPSAANEDRAEADAVAALAGVDAVAGARIGIGAWRPLEAAGVLPSGAYAGWPVADAAAALARECAARPAAAPARAVA